MLSLFQDFLLKAKDVPVDFNSDAILTLTRECLGYYLSLVNKLKDMDEYDKREECIQYSPVCEITMKPILDPVFIRLDNNQRKITDR